MQIQRQRTDGRGKDPLKRIMVLLSLYRTEAQKGAFSLAAQPLQCLFEGIENPECGLTTILTDRAVKAEKQNAPGRKEITRQDYLLCFPLDALSEVIGLGITLITTLLINR